MTRSKRRKLVRSRGGRAVRDAGRAPMVSAAVLAAIAGTQAQAQSPPSTGGTLEEVVVTAQKRAESLQDVPLSIQAIGTTRLEELHVTNFNDYVKFLPSVSFQSIGPGAASVYMRGIASGENSNHSGPQPSVGIYLDEQPITTIQGALDVRIYDIARVEALAGPQGTLYGASSQAGTIRIITNKPDPSGFEAGFDLEGNTVSHGDQGYAAEGFVNIPLGEKMAVRLVGWAARDAGFIDNVYGERTFPSWGGTINNAALVKNNYNDVETYGGRAALKIDLNDSWTVTPQLMGQSQKIGGFFGYDPSIGDLKLTHFTPDYAKDYWMQAALTVEGKIANLDLVYAGAYLKRKYDSQSDYNDYAYFYDVLYGYGAYFYDNDGNIVNPSQYFVGRDHFTKQSHELRLSSSKDNRAYFVAGLFYERQQHDIEQNYRIDDIGTNISVTGWPGTIWLTEQVRVDRDYAAFGELTFNATDKLSLTGGVRFFKSDNSLVGFFGYGAGYSSGTGEAACFSPPTVGGGINGAPCTNLDKSVDETGNTIKLNATWRFTEGNLMYATYSEGFRPGGINRRGTLPPYGADYLKNYEIGWKRTSDDNRLRFNGAIFVEDWDDIQFSYLGANGLTEIRNAGRARVKGVEMDFAYAASERMTWSGGAAYIDGELREDYCEDASSPSCPDAPKGTQLPVTPRFKANLTGRYQFNIGSFNAFAQGAVVHQGNSWSDLRDADRATLGQQGMYTIVDLSVGLGKGRRGLELFIDNAFDERADQLFTTECAISVCGGKPYIYTNRPRTIGLKYNQRF
ncbi:MAG: TonB-dependent receptor [Steroidobacteraceae bacterium]